MDAVRGEPFETCYDSGVTGLTGIAAVQVTDNIGNVVIAPTQAGVIETPPGSGMYCATLTAPAVIGQYSIVWSSDGTFDPNLGEGLDDLFVVNAIAYTPSLPPPAGADIGGPCSAWTTSEAVDACCSAEVVDLALFDSVVGQASQLLYELSGRQFSGICEKTVIACQDTCVSCGQVLSRGHVIGPWDWGGWDGDCCSCGCPPRIKLSGYPVREISEVVIGGVVLDPSAYLLYEHREIGRVDGGLWPSCSAVCNAEDENTITYQYGQVPPLIGAAAAAQLACELFKACAGGDCALPKGTTRVTRQGVVIEKLAFTSFAYTSSRYTRGGRPSGWNTGMPLVDSFLNAFNSGGLKRGSVFWAPGRRYARPVGL